MLHFAFLQNEKETRNFESLIFAYLFRKYRLTTTETHISKQIARINGSFFTKKPYAPMAKMMSTYRISKSTLPLPLA